MIFIIEAMNTDCSYTRTVFLIYIFRLIFMDNPMSTQALTIGNLLWTVIVNDYIFKMITIAIKIIVVMLPIRCVPLIKRVRMFTFMCLIYLISTKTIQCVFKYIFMFFQGKVYLFIEATSQLYRCCLPIQPWLYYLFKSDQSPKKIIGAFLSGTYMVSKSYDLMDRINLWWMAFKKLLQNVVSLLNTLWI